MLNRAGLRVTALCVLYVAPYAAMIYFSLRHAYPLRSVVALLATSLLLGLLLAGCARTWRRFFLLYAPLWLLSLFYAFYAFTYGVVPGRMLGMMMLSASVEEIRGLFELWTQKWLLLALLALAASYLWAARSLPAVPIFAAGRQPLPRVLLVLSLLLTAYAAANAAQLIEGIGLNPAAGTVMFLAAQVPRAHAEINGADLKKVPYHAHRDDAGEEVHVLVIGESARRGDWQVYGYRRPTTPYLQRIRSEIFLLGEVFADANLTMIAVPLILSGMAPADFGFSRVHGNLLDLAKEAGYDTTWLVNQDLDVSMSIGISADHSEYPPERALGLFGRRARDEALLPAYRAALSRGGVPRFIGMHIMESHWEYFRRYPPGFARFGAADTLDSTTLFTRRREADEQMVDAYDNSVLYGDWFFQQVIEAARALRVPATVTFVPDHGESLALFDHDAGHGAAVYDPAQFQIPAFVWVNGAYRAAHPQRVAALEANVDKEIHSHDFFCAVAELMGITWPDFRPECSFASAQFVPDTSREVVVGGVLQVRPATESGAVQAAIVPLPPGR